MRSVLYVRFSLFPAMFVNSCFQEEVNRDIFGSQDQGYSEKDLPLGCLKIDRQICHG
jgi:hypothetical protein